MKTSTKLRLAAKGAGGALGATYRTGKLVGGAQHELTGGRRPVFAWAPAIGGLIAGFSLAYFLDRQNGGSRRSAFRARLAGDGASSQVSPAGPNGRPLADEDEAFRAASIAAADKAAAHGP